MTAIVVRRPRTNVDVEEIRDRVGERRAAFEIPGHLEFATELPRNALGTNMQHRLRTGPPSVWPEPGQVERLP